MSPLQISLAYKYVAIFTMLCQANYCAHKLKLHTPNPITQQDLTLVHVAPPHLRAKGGGALEIRDFSFGFSKRGVLCFITRLHYFEKLPALELHLKQAKLKSQINEQQALELAREWLTSIGVSISDLEKTNKPKVEQLFFYPDATPTGSVSNLDRVLLPIFNVTWVHDDKVAVKIKIYGPTKELLSLRQEDDSFSRRTGGLVKNGEELLSIPSVDFAKYSELQLEELLARHAVVDSETSDFLKLMHGRNTNALTQLRSALVSSSRPTQTPSKISTPRVDKFGLENTTAPSQTNASAPSARR